MLVLLLQVIFGCLLSAGAAASGAAAAKTSEEGTEQVLKVDIETGAVETAEALSVKPGMTVLVVYLAFFRIAEDSVGLVGLLEAGFSLLVARIEIRVVLLGKLAVRFFQFVIRCGAGNAENIIIISFFRHVLSLRLQG